MVLVDQNNILIVESHQSPLPNFGQYDYFLVKIAYKATRD